MISKEKNSEARNLFEKCSPIFIALGDPIRQKLLLEIADAGSDGRNVNDLTQTTNLSRPAVSHHLKVLKDTGLIKPVKKATQIFYQLDLKDKIESIKKLVMMIEEITLFTCE